MFSTPISQVCESLSYDFQKEDNVVKWKGVFVNSLRKVLEQVHPSLEAREDALDHVENLILKMLGILCSHPPPHTPQDVEKRVQQAFPPPIDKWALRDAKDALERGKKKSPLVLPVDKIHQLLQKEVFQHKIDLQVTLFIVGVLEYISADILKLAGNYVKIIRQMEISCEDIRVAMYADMVLMDMFYQDECVERPQSNLNAVVSQTYEESVRDLIQDERNYLRDLHMIIKVFREEIAKIANDTQVLEILFSNIMDIYEVTVTFLGSLEDVMEITEDNQTPTVGSCFEELAEAAEFDVYIKYAKDITSPACKETLIGLLSSSETNTALHSAGHGFREAVKYYLPKLLLQPVWHCLLYFDYIKVLQKRTTSEEDEETLEQVQGLLRPLQMELSEIISNLPKRDSGLRMQERARIQAALEKRNELLKTDGLAPKEIQCCREFIREDVLIKVVGRRLTERRALLFNGLLVLCKASASKRVSVSVGAVTVGGGHQAHHSGELRVKEKFSITKFRIIDRDDNDELKNTFDIVPQEPQVAVTLMAKSPEDKISWIADLVMINTNYVLGRTLNSILSDEERKHPLRLPPPHLYKFCEPDGPNNIVFEARENSGIPLIKGATLVKLIERLTYHIYADPTFVRIFLTTYRSFCSPQELLDLLIMRFDIPDPQLVYQEEERIGSQTMHIEDFKRYRKEFCQPVQFRVINVLRHWVDNHFYDFEQDNVSEGDVSLLEKLQHFLDTVNVKSVRKWVDAIIKNIQRKCEPSEQRPITFTFQKSPPSIEWHLKVPEEEWSILTLHPVEFARQLTLYEFELFRNVKPSELVGSVWTKKEKETASPNLMKIIKHSNNFTLWLERLILETENFDERIAVVSRALEILMVLQDLNNFNAVIAIASAMDSAAVHRLKLTFQAISTSLKKALEEALELPKNHHKKYQEKLRSINPPCVPFFGMYLTNIVHIEDGNPDFLPDSHLINFSKRRKVAEITGEVQQYQNQPYCLSVEPRIRHFIENLEAFDAKLKESEVSDYLYQKSLEIEPRGCKQPLRAARRWPDLNLKSPGIKSRSLTARLPAPLQAVASSVRLHDTSSSSADISTMQDLPETPPHGSSIGDHSVFAPILLGGSNAPASPGASLSMSSLSLGSPGNSPQLGSPGHVPSSHHQSITTHFGFNSGTFSSMGGAISLSSLAGSPGSASMMQPPPSPSHLPHFGQPPPPLPPRTHRRRENCTIDSPQQARQSPNAPQLPPREGISPPPLPPRREVPLSSLQTRVPSNLNPSSSSLLARRNSNLDNTCIISMPQPRRHMSFNGPSPTKVMPAHPPMHPPNGSITPKLPQLPPKPQSLGRPPPTTLFNFNASPGSS